ncbi:MAG: ribosome biogenesis GTPase Der [bacterium]
MQTVTLIGRTNVGKSTLFNRLAGGRPALTASEAHLTRDCQRQTISWNNYDFDLVDTGGLDVDKNDPVGPQVKAQAEHALANADLLLFVLEAGTDLLPADMEIVRKARSSGKRMAVVINKTDKGKKRNVPSEVLRLGFGDPLFVSSLSGVGTGDLLDGIVDILKTLPKKKDKITASETPPITLAFIGKPNVGKSSLTNALLGEERIIVSPIPHTTRTSQFIPLSFQGKDFIVVDTAGLRKQAKTRQAKERLHTMAETLAVRQAKAVVEQADVIGLVIDSSEGLAVQDSHLAQLVTDAGKSLLIIATKWDLVMDKQPDTPNRYRELIYGHYPYLSWVPIVFASGKTKKGVTDILTTASQVAEERHKELPESATDRFLSFVVKKHRPSRGKGVKQPRIIKFKQVENDPPTFELVSEYLNIHPSYLRFLEKQLRVKFGFTGTPIHIKLRALKRK